MAHDWTDSYSNPKPEPKPKRKRKRTRTRRKPEQGDVDVLLKWRNDQGDVIAQRRVTVPACAMNDDVFLTAYDAKLATPADLAREWFKPEYAAALCRSMGYID